MATIDIKLKTYEQLQFEIIKLNTDIVLKDKEIDRLKKDKKKVLELIENDYFEDGSFKNYYDVLNILQGDDKDVNI